MIYKTKKCRFFNNRQKHSIFSIVGYRIMFFENSICDSLFVDFIKCDCLTNRIFFFFTAVKIFAIFFDLNRIFSNLKKKLFNIETKLIENENDERFENFFFESLMQLRRGMGWVGSRVTLKTFVSTEMIIEWKYYHFIRLKW